MISLAERLRAAQMKDVREMEQLFVAAEAGADPDQACREIIGGSFRLMESTKASLLLGR